MRFETRAIHDGQAADASTGAVITPVYQTSTYKQDAVGKHRGFEYSRTDNPTRRALETALASLEEAKHGVAFASGVAATVAVFGLLKKGDHIVAGDDIYGGTYRILEKVVKKWAVSVSYADVDNLSSFKKALRKNTKLIWIETPTNPLLKAIDIKKLSKIAHEAGVLLAVDNTFATPYFQRPLSLGADIAAHSTTKYIAGHSDIIGGAVLVNDERIFQELKFYQNAAGAVPGPWDCWLVLRGLKTLAIRMRAHRDNALYLARYLSKHPKIERVYYPGFSGMLGFKLKGSRAEVDKFFARLKLFTLAESLGGVESLISYPAGMTHSSIPRDERLKRGITDDFIRVSVGIENKLDLKNDIADALTFV